MTALYLISFVQDILREINVGFKCIMLINLDFWRCVVIRMKFEEFVNYGIFEIIRIYYKILYTLLYHISISVTAMLIIHDYI